MTCVGRISSGKDKFPDSFKNKNNPLVDFDDFTNLLITWKDNDAKNKYIKEFAGVLEKEFKGNG